MCGGKPCHCSGAIEKEAADSKYSTDLIFDLRWPEAGTQIMAWTKSTNGYLGLFVSYCVAFYGQPDLTVIAIFFKKWVTGWMQKDKTDIIRRWFVWVKRCLNSDVLWPLRAPGACWLFDVPHAFYLPWWVRNTKPEQGQARFGAKTLRRCQRSNLMDAL